MYSTASSIIVKIAQAQKVELDEADLLDVVLIELRHRRRIAAGRLVDRAEIGDLARRDQNAAGVHADVTRQVLQPAGQVEQFADGFAIAIALHHFLELRLLLQRLGQRHRLVLDNRNELGIRSHIEYGRPNTRPTSRITAFDDIVPKVRSG